MAADKHTKRAQVHVLGCKVNQAEASAMARILGDKGYEIDGEAADPDLIVVNTCCVTAKAEGKSRRAVNRLAKRYPRASLVITGCLAEVNPESVQDVATSQVCLGTFEKDLFRDFIDSGQDFDGSVVRTGASNARTFGDLGSPGLSGRSRTFLKVQDGCSQACTYCIVPRARGRSRSLPLHRAVAEAGALETQGFREVVLTGIHLGHYGKDLDPTTGLEHLIEELLKTCSKLRFRISSVEPPEISDRLIELVAGRSRISRHFHIPLQSGDDRILKRMGRPYNEALIRVLIKKILESIPDACIGLDVMVGFPGEDDDSFRRTRSLVRESGAAYLHVFPFSPRPGTPAAGFKPRIPESVAAERVEELRDLSAEMRRRFYDRFLHRTLSAVPESEPKSGSDLVVVRTDNYIPVLAPAAIALTEKDDVQVRIERIDEDQVYGTLL
jgi:threonylcarbamoyladenosine tRNA methylthiotransferase MtaB